MNGRESKARKSGPPSLGRRQRRVDTRIRVVAVIGQPRERARADPIPARLVDERCHTSIRDDGLVQRRELAHLEIGREVARIAVKTVHRFIEGRRHPGVQVGTYLTAVRPRKFDERRVPLLLRRDTVVDDVGRSHGIAIEDRLPAFNVPHGTDAGARPRERRPPVELLLRVHHHEQQWASRTDGVVLRTEYLGRKRMEGRRCGDGIGAHVSGCEQTTGARPRCCRVGRTGSRGASDRAGPRICRDCGNGGLV